MKQVVRALFKRLFILCFMLAVCCRLAHAADEPLADRVIVLANSDDQESVKLARHYMEKRAVPLANLLALPMPKNETISWRHYIDAIHQPVQDELIRRGWIQGVETTLTDKIGRKRHAISGHRIAYLVICRGVPLRIEHDPALYEAARPFTDKEPFRVNSGAVDAELGLVARSGYAINALVPNPLFGKERPSFLDEAQVVKVARLDGPSHAAAAALVDNALIAERQGLIGRAYVDLHGPHPDGDKWLEEVVRQLDGHNYDLGIDRQPAVLGATARFDAPAFYFGWYAGGLCGPFARPGFRFLPGAIALHIHSFSAQTLHSESVGWCGPLVARGVTATFGNVYEPYLAFTHQPHHLLKALIGGKNLGDAACYALPVLSWQAVLIGDPLYRPFAVPFAEQWRRRRELSDEQFPYVVGRELKRLEKLGQVMLAVNLANESLDERPSLVLALGSAKLLAKSGDGGAALRVLDRVLPLRGVTPERVPVAAEAARFCSDNGAYLKAVEIHRALFALEALTPEHRLLLLPDAIKAAEKADAGEILGVWRQALEALQPKPASAPKT